MIIAIDNLSSFLNPAEIEKSIKLVISKMSDGVGYLQLSEFYELMATSNKNYGGGGAGVYLLFNKYGINKGMAQKVQKIRGLK